MSYASEAVNAQAEGINALTAVQRGTAGIKAPGQTLKVFNGIATLISGGITLATYTVASGKNFYITDFNFTTDVVATLGNVDIQIISGTTASIIARGSTHNLAPWSMTAIESQPQAPGSFPVNILVASVATVPTGHLWYNLFGWEE